MEQRRECPACAEQIPAAAEVCPLCREKIGATAPVGDGEIRTCPFCSEAIPLLAIVCPLCQESLPASPEAKAHALANLDELTVKAVQEGTFPTVEDRFCRRISRSCKVAFAVAALSIAAVAVGAALGPDRGRAKDLAIGFLTIGILVGLFAVPTALAFWIRDLRIPRGDRRTTPLKGFHAFFRSIKARRLDYAQACTLPAGRGPCRRKPIPKVKVVEGEFDLSDPAGFKAYWRDLRGATKGTSRSLRLLGARLIREEGDRAVVRARYEFSGFPTILLFLLPLALLPMAIVIAVLTRKEKVGVEKELRRVNGQWYLCSGELAAPFEKETTE